MAQTPTLLSARFPNVIVFIVMGYFQAEKRGWKHIAAAGEYELCLSVPDGFVDICLSYACRAGHLELVNLMISRGATTCSYCNKLISLH